MDEIINRAYDIIKNKIYTSKEFSSFVVGLTKSQEFKEAFTFNGELKKDVAVKALSDLDILRSICDDNTGIKKEKEFHDMLVNSLKQNNVLLSIADTYFIETLYGNPDRINQEDLTINDKLFKALEYIFNIDIITDFIIDNNSLENNYYNMYNGEFDYSLLVSSFTSAKEIMEDTNNKEAQFKVYTQLVQVLDEIKKDIKKNVK